jgi:hypothetical protein
VHALKSASFRNISALQILHSLNQLHQSANQQCKRPIMQLSLNMESLIPFFLVAASIFERFCATTSQNTKATVMILMKIGGEPKLYELFTFCKFGARRTAININITYIRGQTRLKTGLLRGAGW